MAEIITATPEQTEKKRYKGSAEATAEEKAAVGGEKTLLINNVLFQSDADSQAIADSLLTRLKEEKEYFEVVSEFCPIPVERRDSITVEERIDVSNDVDHLGLVRGLRLHVSPRDQTLTVILEE